LYIEDKVMKKLLICIAAFVFLLGSTFDANAQKRGKGHWEKERKEYAKHHKKRERDFHGDAKYNHSYRKHYDRRDHAYRKYVKQKGLRYRDHDAWYYGKRFHYRTEYVYFPAYRTYYDPYRRGYVYRRNHAWVFAPTMPSFMVGLNVDALNVQFTATVPL